MTDLTRMQSYARIPLKSNMELAVVILNWNAASDTIRCVREHLFLEADRPVIWVMGKWLTDRE